VNGAEAAAGAGALLLCRAAPQAVAPVARLLRQRMLLGEAGRGWSVLVPESPPWTRAEETESVERVVGGWTTALAVAATWPVLGMWWDREGSEFVLASGFRRPVGFGWRADGTPLGGRGQAATDATPGHLDTEESTVVGGSTAGGTAADGTAAGGRAAGGRAEEQEAVVLALVARLGLDPVLDAELLEGLRAPDPETDARARIRGLLAVLTRVGVELPAGLEPGLPSEALCAALSGRAGIRRVEWPGRRDMLRGPLDAVAGGRLLEWTPWSGSRRALGLAAAQVAVGVPVLARGVRRGRGGAVAAGALLTAHGTLGVGYGVLHRGRR
jgi:hypothetical protein